LIIYSGFAKNDAEPEYLFYGESIKEEQSWTRRDKTYAVRKNDDDTYRVVRIITKDEIPALIEDNESRAKDYAKTAIKYAENERPSDFDAKYAKSCLEKAQYYKSCADDLKENKQLRYIIKWKREVVLKC
jgi:hypothetical protein